MLLQSMQTAEDFGLIFSPSSLPPKQSVDLHDQVPNELVWQKAANIDITSQFASASLNKTQSSDNLISYFKQSNCKGQEKTPFFDAPKDATFYPQSNPENGHQETFGQSAFAQSVTSPTNPSQQLSFLGQLKTLIDSQHDLMIR